MYKATLSNVYRVTMTVELDLNAASLGDAEALALFTFQVGYDDKTPSDLHESIKTLVPRLKVETFTDKASSAHNETGWQMGDGKDL